MILERGNMWDVFGHTDLFLITTNPIVNRHGQVVMGRGIAKQAAERFPEMPHHLAARLASRGDRGCDTIHMYEDGKLSDDEYLCQVVGYFMVKDHWREPALLSRIEQSVEALVKGIGKNKYVRVDLNFPGIGNGRLSREQVLPIIDVLPDNVHVWEYGA